MSQQKCQTTNAPKLIRFMVVIVMMKRAVRFVLFSCWLGSVSAFVVMPRNGKSATTTMIAPTTAKQGTLVVLYAETKEFEAILSTRYPTFNAVLRQNEELWKKLRAPEVQGFTAFCPSEAAMRNLGEKKLFQLNDARNLETTTKIGLFHFLDECVSAEKLFNSAGVITLSGDVVPVERSVSGGFMGIGGTEDGGTTVGGARVTASEQVGCGLLHEVDELVSPNILWRYMDQLRIPGSK